MHHFVFLLHGGHLILFPERMPHLGNLRLHKRVVDVHSCLVAVLALVGRLKLKLLGERGVERERGRGHFMAKNGGEAG